jgi:FkbM family methyltransferase
MYETILNFLIRNNFQSLNKILFHSFKFFLKKRIVLNFLKYKFYAYPQKKELSRWMIRNLKIWDKNSVEIILNQIKNDNAIFIDIGSNYGAYSIPVAKLKNRINVYCFDPSEKALNQLKDNIELNDIKNIKYFKVGVGEKKKTVFFNDEIKNYKNSGSYEINNKVSGKKILINSIDNLIENNEIIPKKNIIIKMDVEGYEFLVLQGLIKTIKKYDVFIFFEFSIKIIANHDNLLISFTKFLKQNNLKIFNSEFYEVKIEDLFDKIKHLPKRYEVLDNYIISKNINFY